MDNVNRRNEGFTEAQNKVSDALVEVNDFLNNLGKREDLEGIYDYNQAIKQIDKTQKVTFGSKINVLLITDRLQGCAKGLQEYLQNSTDINVDLVFKLEDAQKEIEQKPFDFLIIVGFLQNRKNYKVKGMFQRLNRYSSTVMYALLDSVIYSECRRYSIKNMYNRREPIDGFILYMQNCYAENITQLHSDFPEEEQTEELKKCAWKEAYRSIEQEMQNEKKRQLNILKRERQKENLYKFSQIAFVVFLCGFIALSLYLNMQPYKIDLTKEYRYSKVDEELIITAYANSESVHITINRNLITDDGEEFLFETEITMTKENAEQNGLINIQPGLLGKTVMFSENKIILYCFFELAVH